MAVFRVERNKGYTVMSNHHLRNKELSLKAKGLLSQMLSLPEDWDFTLAGLSHINREKIDAVREAVKELERAGYIVRSRERDEKGRLRGAEYVIYEKPQKPTSDLPTLENPTLGIPALEKPTQENPTQLNTNKEITEQSITNGINYSSINQRAAEDRTDRTDEREIYRDIIQDNIDYEIISQTSDGERISEIVEIMLDAVCTNKPTVRINGEEIPKEAVKSRFLKLDSEHIEYVLLAMQRSPSEIRNIRAYLLTALYNAPTTMDNYYTALVNHDTNNRQDS